MKVVQIYPFPSLFHLALISSTWEEAVFSLFGLLKNHYKFDVAIKYTLFSFGEILNDSTKFKYLMDVHDVRISQFDVSYALLTASNP